MASRALVLGGGGATGFAWEWGVLSGLHDAEVDLTGVDLIVGTSAGALAAANLTGLDNPHELVPLFSQPLKRPTTPGPERLGATLSQLTNSPLNPHEIRVALGAMALATETATEQDYRQVIADGVPSSKWPPQHLLITAVDAHSGELVLFHKGSGAGLVDAVAASCAVPGIWPPVTIGDRRYIDGGFSSPTNAALAAGYDSTLVLAPQRGIREIPGTDIEEQLAPLRPNGKVTVVRPDEFSRESIGRDVWAMSRRAAAVEAGRTQARSVLPELDTYWRR